MIRVHGVEPGMSLEDVARLHGYRWERTFEGLLETYHWKDVGLKLNWDGTQILLIHGDEISIGGKSIRVGDPLERFFPEFEDSPGWRDFRIGPSEWLRVYSLDDLRTCARFTFPLPRTQSVIPIEQDNAASQVLADAAQAERIRRILEMTVPEVVKIDNFALGTPRAEVESFIGIPRAVTALNSSVLFCDYGGLKVHYAACGRALILTGTRLRLGTYHFSADDPIAWLEEKLDKVGSFANHLFFRVASDWELAVTTSGAACKQFEFPRLPLAL